MNGVLVICMTLPTSLSSDPEDDASILVLVDETGIPREDKEELTAQLTEVVGMNQDEKYGSLVFSGSLQLLNSITESIARTIENLQVEGKIFPALRRNMIDAEFRDALLQYSVFRRFWDVDEKRSTLLTYDINHKYGGRNARRYYALRSVGALKIFNSCYWIPETKIQIISTKFQRFVDESNANPLQDKSGNAIHYHYRVFRCYAVGSIEGLKRWRDMQLNLLLDTITSIHARTMSRQNYLRYIRRSWDAFDRDERMEKMKKAKKLRYWKNEAIAELRPYLDAHIKRMENMGIAHQVVTRDQTYETYDDDGNKVRDDVSFTLNIQEGLNRLTEALNNLHHDAHAFVTSVMIDERPPSQGVSAEDFTVNE